VNTDLQNMMTIEYQMMAARNMQGMERWRIMQDAQTKTFEVNQSMTLNTARAAKKLADKWDQFVQR